MADTAKKDESATKKGPRHGRSPAYPFIPFDEALKKADALYKAEGRHAVPLSSAFKAWGFGDKSSGGRQTLAALRYFGLITYEGDGPDRKVKVSDEAFRVLADEREDQSERRARETKLALSPTLYSTLQSVYPAYPYDAGSPSDGTVKHHLVHELGFSPGGAEEALKAYKDTIAYVSGRQPAKTLDEGKGDERDNGSAVRVGDLVQWESQGTLQWKEPKRVTAIAQHEGKSYLSIEGEKGAIPMNEATVMDPKAGKPGGGSTPPPLLQPRVAEEAPSADIRKEVTSLDEGAATLMWPADLSADSYRDLEHWIAGILKKAARRAGVIENGQK